MTEKRFERIYADVNIFCRDHNAKGISQLIEKEDYDTIVDLLNSLNDENERLKKERNHFERKKTEYLTEWNTCRIQNTEIKNTIQEAYNTERTELGRSVLKQLLEAIQ